MSYVPASTWDVSKYMPQSYPSFFDVTSIGDDEEYVPISGKVDSKYIDDDSKIYVRLKSEDNEYTYEAFPAPIDVTSKNEGYDYGMYLDTSQVEAGTYDIDVITQKDNKYYSSGVKTSLELEE